MRLADYINESPDIDPYQVIVELYDKSFPYLKEYMNSFRIDLKTPMLFSGRKNREPYFTRSIRTDRYPRDTPPQAHNFMDEVFYKAFGVRARSNSIFVVGKVEEAKNYGKVYGIFPNGTNYKIIWSPKVDDLYARAFDYGDFTNIGSDFDELARHMGSDDYELRDSVHDRLGEMFDSENSKHDFLDDKGNFDHNKYNEARDIYIDHNFDWMIRDMAMEKARDIVFNEESEFKKLVQKDYKEGDLRGAILSNNEIMLSGKSYTAVRYDYLPYVLRYIEVNRSKKPTPELFTKSLIGFKPEKFPMVSGQKQPFRMSDLSKEILSILDISDLKKK
jgi:hypothetical protein